EMVGGLDDPGGMAVHRRRLGAVVGDLGVLAEVGDDPRGGGVALEERDRGALGPGVAALVLRAGDPAEVDDAVPVALDDPAVGPELGGGGQRADDRPEERRGG